MAGWRAADWSRGPYKAASTGEDSPAAPAGVAASTETRQTTCTHITKLTHLSTEYTEKILLAQQSENFRMSEAEEPFLQWTLCSNKFWSQSLESTS